MSQDVPPQIAPAPVAPEPQVPETTPKVSRLTRADWVQVGIGFGIGVVFIAVKGLNWVASYLSILVHETGHWIAGMLFGYPSIPAFDFREGGGFTFHQERSLFGLFCIYVLALLPFFWLRRNKLGLAVWGGVVLLFALAAHTRLHDFLILAAGHGFEVLMAGVFLYRAWANAAINTPAERPLYAGLGLFMIWHVLAFAWLTIFDIDRRAWYLQGKLVCANDVVRIQDMTGLSMNTWLWMLMFFAIGTVALSYLAYRYQNAWRAWVWRAIE